MGKGTKIEWCDHTFSPWRGCSKVSPGCKFCYAETQSKRNPAVLGVWGDSGTRVVASESMWREPPKWDREAEKEGVRRRVFCASLADVFEHRPELRGPRERLFRLIRSTPRLDWLLLTKRPENIPAMLKEIPAHGHPWPLWDAILEHRLPNVWFGTSVEDQKIADERIPALARVPAIVRFVSFEPLLGPVRLDAFFTFGNEKPFHWAILGGESGPNARVCEIDWIRKLKYRCEAAAVAVFVKQLGARASDPPNGVAGKSLAVPEDARGLISLRLADAKGGDPEEWPDDLKVRDFPTIGQKGV